MESHRHGSGPALQVTSGFNAVSKPVKTFYLRDNYDPKPASQRTPVAIRPPSPKPGPPQEPFVRCKLSCEPKPKPIMRRRAKSLSSSTDEHTCRNVQVRFVDSLGLDLEDVKFFKASEHPSVPIHVITRLLASSELASRKKLELSLPYFQPFFSDNMGAEPDFLRRLCHQRVCLEQLFCSELGIIGIVQVLNLAYEKEVTVRYSFTDWKSSADSKACWLSTVYRDAADPESDMFSFHLPVPPFIMQSGAMLQFAICFRVRGSEYWDNNNGCNYKLACQTYKLTVPRECEDSLVHFT
ncbi:protein phosphatase 1, regulatory subunit 3Db [Myxocyprinus asiaticus]|uniref:protein phosphatase 1, regulatory subunit 3Db n=1 Tax=Myxocyprinus asiaticus TaxID=70543 RepID=UPI0022226A1F|nr:protein phosphatase 1, regulatory subunit 3Db [Myxocyprinus asiaticus]XP_051532549.1 protein phosphatase 1, regulatory subunit 3Db [Myxocyprinus asiaticus]